MNLVKIATAAAVECERQQVGISELGFLIGAYESILDMRDDEEYEFNLHSLVALGKMVEPFKNHHGFRTTPVTFQDGGSSAPASEITRLIGGLVDFIQDFQSENRFELTVDDIVSRFLWIHPFRDGNGRVGFLLQNYLAGTLDSPEPLTKHF